jgi:hypothetical protein
MREIRLSGLGGRGSVTTAPPILIFVVRGKMSALASSSLFAYSTIANALTYAADHGARVANISFKASDSSTVTSAAQYFQSKGGVTTISAGNEGTFDTTTDNPYASP